MIMKMQKKIFSTFVLIIAIPTVAFLMLLLQISTRMVENRTVSATELVVRESVKRIDTLLTNYRNASMQIYYNRNIIGILEGFQSGSAGSEDLRILSEVLGGMVNADKYLMSAVLRAGGNTVIRGSKSFQIEAYLDRNHDQSVEAGGQLIWIPSTKIKTVFGLDSFYFGAMRQIRKDDSAIAELLFLIREEFFDDIYAGAIPDDTGRDLIVSSDGVVISAADETLIGSSYDFPAAADIIERRLGRHGSLGIRDGRHRSYLIYARSKESGWYFIRQIEEEQILSGISRLRKSLVAVILLFCLFLVFLTYIFSQGLSRPVNNLVKYIDAIGAGSLDIPPPSARSASDEIIMLHERLFAMSARIEGLIGEVSANERLKTQAELKALRTHISPHFIYNALDSIRWMAVINKQDNIRNMVGALDRLMRCAADYETALISLNEEIEIIEQYVYIQKMRYSDIRLVLDIPSETGALQVNKFILQTIVENSIVHGFRDYRSTGTIRISARTEEGDLILNVDDDGRGFRCGDEIGSEHTGLRSVDQRLKLNYGGAYGLSVKSEPDRGTSVSLRLPAEGVKNAEEHCYS